MYTITSRISVTPGMMAEYDGYSERFLEYCRQVPGMLSVFQEADLSYPGRFIVSTTLDSYRAAQAWSRSPDLKAILQQATPGMFTLAGDVEGWVIAAGSPPRNPDARPAYHVVSFITINARPGTSAAFESRMRESVAVFEQHGRGLTHAVVARLAGSTTRYLYATAFLSPADAAATFAAPEIVRDMSGDPNSLGIEAMATELREIVRVFARQPATAR